MDIESTATGHASADTTANGTGPEPTQPPASTSPPGKIRGFLRRQGEEYRDGEERPLAGYTALLSVYCTGTVGVALLARALGRTAPQLHPWDVVQLTATTQKVARIITKDPVTSPFRSPFTTYTGVSAPSELAEEVRGHGLRHSVGELVTCPMCIAQWVATAFTFGLVFAPRPTRLAMSTFTAVAGADFLQHLYVALQKASE